jgi:hypothetical protein
MKSWHRRQKPMIIMCKYRASELLNHQLIQTLWSKGKTYFWYMCNQAVQIYLYITALVILFDHRHSPQPIKDEKQVPLEGTALPWRTDPWKKIGTKFHLNWIN